jgi:hypothetical protein
MFEASLGDLAPFLPLVSGVHSPQARRCGTRMIIVNRHYTDSNYIASKCNKVFKKPHNNANAYAPKSGDNAPVLYSYAPFEYTMQCNVSHVMTQ